MRLRHSGRAFRAACGVLPILLPAGTASAADAEAAPQAPAERPVAVTYDTHGIAATFADGRAKLVISGRLYLDAAGGWTDPDVDAFPDHFEVREARPQATLTIDDRLVTTFQFDFADEESPFKDVGMGLTLGPVLISAGNFKEPFSFEELVSDAQTDFLEPSLADGFPPSRALGAAASVSNQHWTASLGVFGSDINDDNGTDGIGVTGRGTFAPINGDQRLVHFGLAASFRDPDGTGASFSSSPESHLFAPSLVDTGDLADASHVFLFGAESAVQFGKFRLQGEFELAHVERSANPDATFTGGYISAGWTINGDGRPYKIKDDFGIEVGIFGGVAVKEAQRISKGGIGVWEATARISHMDLEDAGVAGGTETNFALGLAWYPEPNIRVLANYIHAEADNSPVTGGDVSADIVQGRFQIAY